MTSDLTSHDPTASAHRAWPAFVREVTGKRYDAQALGRAWTWARWGWDAAVESRYESDRSQD
jgi:hypothetical protein